MSWLPFGSMINRRLTFFFPQMNPVWKVRKEDRMYSCGWHMYKAYGAWTKFHVFYFILFLNHAKLNDKIIYFPSDLRKCCHQIWETCLFFKPNWQVLSVPLVIFVTTLFVIKLTSCSKLGMFLTCLKMYLYHPRQTMFVSCRNPRLPVAIAAVAGWWTGPKTAINFSSTQNLWIIPGRGLMMSSRTTPFLPKKKYRYLLYFDIVQWWILVEFMHWPIY